MNTKLKPDYIIYDEEDFPLFIGKKSECMKYLNYTRCQAFDDLVHSTKVNPLRDGKRVFRIEDD